MREMSDSVVLYEYEGQGYRVAKAADIFGYRATLEQGVVEQGVGYRAATAEEFYGSRSEVASVVAVEHYRPMLSSEPLYHGVVALTLVVYLYMMLRSWKFIGSIWGSAFARRSERHMVAEGGVLPLQRFKQVAACLGAIVVALVIVRLAEMVIPATSAIYVDGLAPYATVVSMLLIVVYLAWFYAMHKVVGWVTYSDVAVVLASIGYMNFVRCVTLLYPLTIVWLLSAGDAMPYMSLVVIISAILLLLLYLKDTFLFFVAKKISILYFILYLCTAILLPVSFLLHLIPIQLA